MEEVEEAWCRFWGSPPLARERRQTAAASPVAASPTPRARCHVAADSPDAASGIERAPRRTVGTAARAGGGGAGPCDAGAAVVAGGTETAAVAEKAPAGVPDVAAPAVGVVDDAEEGAARVVVVVADVDAVAVAVVVAGVIAGVVFAAAAAGHAGGPPLP